MDTVEWPPDAVPCGKCSGCRRERARQWTIRLVHESQLHERVSEVTLTYSDDHLPPGRSLNPKHPTLFFKSLRNAGHVFRYFMCGEYGDEKGRPHYHVLLYGLDWPDRTYWMRSPGGTIQYRSDQLQSHWEHGFALTGDLTPGASRYVAGYVTKKLNDSESPVSVETGELLQPYQRMSRRPAIAKRWIERYWRETYATDTVLVEGREMRPPAFYDRWLKDNEPVHWRSVREARYHQAQSRPKESAKRLRQRCEAIDLKQAPFENRPGEFQ